MAKSCKHSTLLSTLHVDICFSPELKEPVIFSVGFQGLLVSKQVWYGASLLSIHVSSQQMTSYSHQLPSRT